MKSKNSITEVGALIDVQRIGAGFCLLLGLVGAGLGVHLTRLKFQMLYTPCLSAYGGCRIGGLDCDDALGSSMSIFLGLPISLWGTAFYLTTAVASAAALRRDAWGGTAAHLLLCLAGFSVLVSMVLGTYTVLALTTACPFCLSLYAVSVLLLGGAFLVWRPPGAPHVPFDVVRRKRLADALDGVFGLAMVLVLATGLQSMVFNGLRNRVNAQDGCPEPVAALPAPSIRVGVTEPQAILALFLDMTCTKCRSEFKKVGLALKEGKFPAPVQLWIFHIPRQACDLEALPAYDRTDDNARADRACMAARAVECIEKLQPGAGFELIGGMFALHDNREEDTPLFTTERIGNKAVELGMEIDPDDEDNAFVRCINHDTEVLARITEHQRYADGPNFSTPTLMIYHAVAGAPDMSRKPLVANANTSLATIMEYVVAQAAETQP